MNHELLFLDNIFQKTFTPSGGDAVSTKNRSTFHTDSSAQSNKDDFAKYLNANKHNNEAKKNERSASEAKNRDSKAQAFATKETKIGSQSMHQDDVEMSHALNIADIMHLQEDIKRLVALQLHSDDFVEDASSITDQLVVPETEGDGGSSQKIDSVFALIASALSDEDGDDSSMLLQDVKDRDFISLLGRIRDALENDGIPSLTTGLTIEQLTALDKNPGAYVEGELSSEEKEILEKLAAQWVTLIQPRENAHRDTKSNEIQVKADIDAPVKTALNDNVSKQIFTEERHYTQTRYEGRYSVDARSSDSVTDADQASAGFKSVLKPASEYTTSHSVIQNTPGAAERFLQNANALSALPAFDVSPDYAQALGITQTGSQASLVHNPLTSVITQSQNATQPHPATQMVSATIQKAVKAGEDTNIKLRLDQPELGRVEVKMSIDKDNTAKIVLTAEKPETFMMLQKDSHVLQQALNDSGLDLEGDIAFELASDSHDFEHDSGRDERGRNSGRGESDSDNAMIIETTMDWHVDPDTGHLRYDILV